MSILASLVGRVSKLAPIWTLLAVGLLAPGDMSPAAKKYLDAALDQIQRTSGNRHADWGEMRKRAYAAAKDAKSPEETNPGIDAALAYLADGHTYRLTPGEVKAESKALSSEPTVGMTIDNGYVVRVFPDGPAARAGVKLGMKVIGEDDYPMLFASEFQHEINVDVSKHRPVDLLLEDRKGQRKHYVLKPEITADDVDPSGRFFAGGYGYIDVPSFAGGNDIHGVSYANKLQNAIIALDSQNLKGWIVDLRLNVGGNMFPMLAGLGPLLGNVTLGYFVSSTDRQAWAYNDGRVIVGGLPLFGMNPYRLKHRKLPIAVLISDQTNSAGEISAISFIGMPCTTVIGEDSGGLTTDTKTSDLGDGSELVVSNGVDADRTGKRYDGPIHPNKVVVTNWDWFGTEKDAAIVAAKKWISAYGHRANLKHPVRKR